MWIPKVQKKPKKQFLKEFIETYIKPPAELGRFVDASGDEWSIRIKASVVQ